MLHQLARAHEVIHRVTIFLLVDAVEVLDCRHDRFGLNTAHQRDVHVRAQERVLPTCLRAAPIARIAAQVQSGTELLVFAVGVKLPSHGPADVEHHLLVPRRGHRNTRRKRSRIHKPHPMRTVRHHESRDAKHLVVRCRPEGIPSNLVHFLEVGHLVDFLLNQVFERILSVQWKAHHEARKGQKGKTKHGLIFGQSNIIYSSASAKPKCARAVSWASMSARSIRCLRN